MGKLFLLLISLILVCSKPQTFLLEGEEEINNPEYIEPSQELRAVWVSPWGGDEDLVTYVDESDFKKKMTYILDTIKMYNMNTIIYHVRTHNDALYKSKLNPKSHYWSKVDFDKFDPLKWMIAESHKRGLEFHAWMNPYRIKSRTTNATSLDEIAKSYASFPLNPASKISNMLKGTNTVILNPGLENVRNFIVDSVIELMQNYNVDAIHFDDYFYINMGANGATSGKITILDEPDQNTYTKFIDEHPSYNFSKTKATDKADWRRLQVDFFIEQLSQKIKNFNIQFKKYIELGISPTGIYKNGNGEVTYDKDGNAITNGSETGGQTHFSSYLFCDTLKWINKEWINYILPQSYWAFTHPTAGYERVMGWWNKVVKYKKVNLYSGMGLYMADLSVKTYGWQNDMNELGNQCKFCAKSEYIDGASIYNFNTLRKGRDHKESKSVTQVKNALNNTVWKQKVPASEKKFLNKIKLPKVNNFKVQENTISFDKIDGARFYLIYRNKDKVMYDSAEIIDIFGSEDKEITWKDKEIGSFNYGVKALSFSNTLGEGI